MVMRLDSTDLNVQGALNVTGVRSDIDRTDFASDTLVKYTLDARNFRVFDALGTFLPTTSASDDLAVAGTFATAPPVIQTGDVKTLTVSRFARTVFVLPVEYVAASNVVIRCSAGMVTTVADVSANLDIELYESDREGGVSADLVSTGAQSINSLTFANYDYSVTSTTLAAGDQLDIRLNLAVSDSATGTEVNARIGQVEILLTVKG